MGQGILYRGAGGNIYNMLYAELEYIESTGTQYIDTGYSVVSNTKIEIDFKTTTIPTNSDAACIFIATPTWVYQSFSLFYRKSSGNMTFHGDECNFGTYLANTNYHFTGTMGANGTLTNLDTGTSTTTSLGTNSGLSNLCLLGISTDSARRINIKLKSCKIYTGTTLERDLVPVINTQNYEVGLYDKVTKEFYKNAGNGTFGYAFKDLKEARKICDFNINYIQSHGKEHMTTGITTKAKHWFDITMQFDVINDYMFTFGRWSSLSVGAKNNKLVIGGGATEMNLSSYTVSTGTRYNIKSGQANTIINNTSIQNATHDNSTGQELYLFSNNYIWDSTYGYSRSRIYNLKLYNGTFNDTTNSTLEREWVPFKFKENSTCGLYDKVENKIYLNEGSGAFTFG